jgi:hypothetical protein
VLIVIDKEERMLTKKQKENVIKKFLDWIEKSDEYYLCNVDSGEWAEYYPTDNTNESIIDQFLKSKITKKVK